MIIDKRLSLARLNGSGPSEIYDLARAFLSEGELQPVSDRPVHVKASEALRLWDARLKNTALTHRAIHGAALLVARLRSLDPDCDLEQIGLMSPKAAGNLFFASESGDLIGLAIVNRPDISPAPEPVG
jgi:hypothetical protein